MVLIDGASCDFVEKLESTNKERICFLSPKVKQRKVIDPLLKYNSMS